ncbi:MAG: hypothetical protein K2Y22_03900 [Candidatus Obscuribacterales bacterium]|nr:hypothetical protein [Candidatus Obscuribacterales bacterium]
MVLMRSNFNRLFHRACATILCVLTIQPWLTHPAIASSVQLSPSAAQAADILGINTDVEQLLGGSVDRQKSVQLRAFCLRRILQGILQVQSAENRLEVEMAYAYDMLSKKQRQTNTINEAFTVANFSQLAVLYGLFEPYSRIAKKFKQSAVGTTVGSGLAIGLPTINIVYNKFDRARHLAPPASIKHIVDGRPVDGRNLPPLVASYFNMPAPGEAKSRREELNIVWKKRFGADINNDKTLAGIDDKKSKKIFVLNRRIVLLWSLYSTVMGFNKELLSLLKEISSDIANPNAVNVSLSGGADEAMRLLKLEPLVAELKDSAGQLSPLREQELKVQILQSVLIATLEMQIAGDRCQEELNYQYDVVLSQMMARRGAVLQKLFELNFIQMGTLGACAGWCYLKEYGQAGNELFITADAIATILSTVTLVALHGGWRKNQSKPNSLADFFHLRAETDNGFSPLVNAYLDSTSPLSKEGKTRRNYLNDVWTKYHVTTMNLKNRHDLEKLANMPSCKWDTIKLVINRIALLSSLREHFWQFDGELADLLRQVWPQSTSPDADDTVASLNPFASGAAKLLGATSLVRDSLERSDENAKIAVTRLVLQGYLDTNSDSDKIGRQSLIETQVRDQMIRRQNTAITLTNNLNFYQIGILGIISDSMGLSSYPKTVLDANRVNIVSGYLIAGLAGASVIEHQGFWGRRQAQPNAINAALGKGPSSFKLTPVMERYLNAPSPFSSANRTRREDLIAYWKESRVVNKNIDRPSTIEKLSAEGKAHHFWNETINLISNRITMLNDLRTILRTSSHGFGELIGALN